MLPELSEVAIWRKALGLTQAELAAKARVSRSFVAKLETGHLSPSYALMKALFVVLDGLEEGRRGGLGLGGFRVGDVHASPVETVGVGDSLRDVWIRMVETCFSQFPVVDGSEFMGSVTERDVNIALMDHNGDVEALVVSEIMGPPFPTVDIDVPLKAVVSLLGYRKAVLSVERGRVVGIVTNSDVGKILLTLEERKRN